jgi:predicted Fe-S protein YdhL (DUF1289 family)
MKTLITMKDNNKEKLTDSPCVRNCCLDGEDICIGCLRHIDEIIAWKSYSIKEKEQVIVLCQQRQNRK